MYKSSSVSRRRIIPLINISNNIINYIFLFLPFDVACKNRIVCRTFNNVFALSSKMIKNLYLEQSVPLSNASCLYHFLKNIEHLKFLNISKFHLKYHRIEMKWYIVFMLRKMKNLKELSSPFRNIEEDNNFSVSNILIESKANLVFENSKTSYPLAIENFPALKEIDNFIPNNIYHHGNNAHCLKSLSTYSASPYFLHTIMKLFPNIETINLFKLKDIYFFEFLKLPLNIKNKIKRFSIISDNVNANLMPREFFENFLFQMSSLTYLKLDYIGPMLFLQKIVQNLPELQYLNLKLEEKDIVLNNRNRIPIKEDFEFFEWMERNMPHDAQLFNPTPTGQEVSSNRLWDLRTPPQLYKDVLNSENQVTFVEGLRSIIKLKKLKTLKIQFKGLNFLLGEQDMGSIFNGISNDNITKLALFLPISVRGLSQFPFKNLKKLHINGSFVPRNIPFKELSQLEYYNLVIKYGTSITIDSDSLRYIDITFINRQMFDGQYINIRTPNLSEIIITSRYKIEYDLQLVAGDIENLYFSHINWTSIQIEAKSLTKAQIKSGENRYNNINLKLVGSEGYISQKRVVQEVGVPSLREIESWDTVDVINKLEITNEFEINHDKMYSFLPNGVVKKVVIHLRTIKNTNKSSFPLYFMVEELKILFDQEEEEDNGFIIEKVVFLLKLFPGIKSLEMINNNRAIVLPQLLPYVQNLYSLKYLKLDGVIINIANILNLPELCYFFINHKDSTKHVLYLQSKNLKNITIPLSPSNKVIVSSDELEFVNFSVTNIHFSNNLSQIQIAKNIFKSYAITIANLFIKNHKVKAMYLTSHFNVNFVQFALVPALNSLMVNPQHEFSPEEFNNVYMKSQATLNPEILTWFQLKYVFIARQPFLNQQIISFMTNYIEKNCLVASLVQFIFDV